MATDTQNVTALDLGTISHSAPVQTGVMVSLITLVAQAFARPEVRGVFHVDPSWVAIIVAGLIALYQVRFTQKCGIGQCLVLVPLSTLILFGLALASNNFVAAQQVAPQPATPPPSQVAPAAGPDLVTNLKQQVDLQKQVIEELQKTLVQPGPQSARETGTKTAWLDSVMGALVPSAQAQDMTPEERRRLEQKLKEYQMHLKKLEVQQKVLEQTPSAAKKKGEAKPPAAQEDLWKTWGGARQQ